MTVTLPAQGAFAVYDEKGAVVNYSLVSGSNEVKLPANGAVVFAGAPGSAFGITLRTVMRVGAGLHDSLSSQDNLK